MGSVPANSHAVEIAPARTVPAGSKIGRPTIKSGHADIAARPPRRRHVRFSGSGRSAPPRETGLHHTAPSASACEARRRQSLRRLRGRVCRSRGHRHLREDRRRVQRRCRRFGKVALIASAFAACPHFVSWPSAKNPRSVNQFTFAPCRACYGDAAGDFRGPAAGAAGTSNFEPDGVRFFGGQALPCAPDIDAGRSLFRTGLRSPASAARTA